MIIVPPVLLNVAAAAGPLPDAPAPAEKSATFQDLLAKISAPEKVSPGSAEMVDPPPANEVPDDLPVPAPVPEPAKPLPGIETADAPHGTGGAKKETYAEDASPQPAAVWFVTPQLEPRSLARIPLEPQTEARPIAVAPRETLITEKTSPRAPGAPTAQDSGPAPRTQAVAPREAVKSEMVAPRAPGAPGAQGAGPAPQTQADPPAEAPRHEQPHTAILAASDHPLPPAEAKLGAPAFAAGLPAEHAARVDDTAAAPASSAPASAAPLSLGEPSWEGPLSARIVWMASQRQQVAELRVNPPELGPVKIKLALDDDKAVAQFVSPHAPVRAALEQALPQLQQMLAQNGITLSNATVGSEAFQEQPQAQGREPAPQVAAGDAMMINMTTAPLRTLRGLVDTFA